MEADKERPLQAAPASLTVSFEEQVTEQHTILFKVVYHLVETRTLVDGHSLGL